MGEGTSDLYFLPFPRSLLLALLEFIPVYNPRVNVVWELEGNRELHSYSTFHRNSTFCRNFAGRLGGVNMTSCLKLISGTSRTDAHRFLQF